MNLQDKVALVTGGTRGIGAATTLALAQAGAHVAAMGRTDDDETRALLQTVRALGRRAEFVPGDCAVPEENTRAVETCVRLFGGLDVLIHSAGGAIPGGLLEVSPEAWNTGFAVHVHAIYHLCRAAVPHMRTKPEGAIVLISSTAGKLGVMGNLAYQVVKGAIPQFARALARELAPNNIRVNCVAPGVIRTRFHAQMSDAQKKLNLEQRIPLRREGTPEQVASLILEMVRNDYITGDTVTIDGGLTMRIP